MEIPTPLTLNFIEAHTSAPISGNPAWSRVPNALGEYLYAVLYMLGAYDMPKPIDSDYPKILYTDNNGNNAIITHNDKEGWEINHDILTEFMESKKAEGAVPEHKE